MTNEDYEISAFFPAFNEELNLEHMVQDLGAALGPVTKRYEIIIVNDGSTDKTGQMADRLAAEHAEVRVVHHRKNKGYGQAVISGIRACRYPLLFWTDGDRQFDMKELGLLLRHIEKYDMVTGYRADRADNLVRKLYSRCWTGLVRLLLGVRVRDLNCAFKLFHARVTEDLDLRTTANMINAEILSLARKKGCTLFEVPVTHLPRVAGEETGGSPLVIFTTFWELSKFLFRFWSYKPKAGAKQRIS